jgi:hypothetical protein
VKAVTRGRTNVVPKLGISMTFVAAIGGVYAGVQLKASEEAGAEQSKGPSRVPP